MSLTSERPQGAAFAPPPEEDTPADEPSRISRLLTSRLRNAGGIEDNVDVLAAAALQCIGGQMQGRLMPLKDEERERAEQMGADITKKYGLGDMAHGDVIFSATGVTSGSLLEGVHFHGEFAETETLVMRSKTGTVRRVRTTYRNVRRKLALL